MLVVLSECGNATVRIFRQRLSTSPGQLKDCSLKALLSFIRINVIVAFAKLGLDFSSCIFLKKPIALLKKPIVRPPIHNRLRYAAECAQEGCLSYASRSANVAGVGASASLDSFHQVSAADPYV